MSAHERAAEEIARDFASYRCIEELTEVLQRHFPDWQDISSAPRDGTIIDLIRNGERVPDCRWWEPGKCFVTVYDDFECLPPDLVTHWKPIGPLPGRAG